MDWDHYFISLSYVVASKSKDTSTQVGAVIVGPDHEIRSTGYNSFPRGLDDAVPARFLPPLKYNYFEHAERNAVYNAARMGTSCLGCTMYLPWRPCTDCARAIIQSGITTVVLHLEHPGNHEPGAWRESQSIGAEMLAECGVAARFWSGTPHLMTYRYHGTDYRLDATLDRAA